MVVTGSDTQAWTKALWGFALGGHIRGATVVVADRIAYDSHYLGLLQVCELTGASIEVVPSAATARSTSTGCRRPGSGPVALAALTHVGTHRGLVNPVAEAGDLCRRAGVPDFLDACQSIGQLPVDVGRIRCDVATITGRKWLRGPRGTGLLFVGPHWPSGSGHRASAGVGSLGRCRPLPVPAGGGALRRLRGPHRRLPRVGVAIDHALALGIDAIAERVGRLSDSPRATTPVGDGVAVHDGGGPRSGIVTFTVEGASPAEVKRWRRRPGSTCR